MSIFKCKMCGGTIEFEPGASVGVCDSCGTKQTLPRLDDDRRANLYDRANHFRRNNEFDKAAGIYEQILNEDTTDAEAYWSLVLCRYGIEYVEDPATRKRVPTVNRAQFTSIFDDENYQSALEHADAYQRMIYEDEANAINEIQKGILAISQKEEPFDVFICYKETDNNGRRTPDSVLANDLYHQLTQEGFKVFFARITLEDKLGTAYEPYIFAALNSAKVMVALGTRPEYFNAVWVKNEWSRYLSLVKQSGGKKMLIPAYKDMDPYDLPDEFSHLQAQDMSKLGFMQDLIRGIKKIAKADEPKAQTVKETVVVQESGNANTRALVKRGNQALEDREWENAEDFFNRALDLDAECAEAFMGKFLASQKVVKMEDLVSAGEPRLKMETVTCLKPDYVKINELTEKYAIKKYFEPKIIKNILYYYNFSYSSGYESAEREANARSLLFTDKNYLRAVKYAGADYKAKLIKLRTDNEQYWKNVIKDCEEHDKAEEQRLKAEYDAFFIERENDLAEQNALAEEKRRADYDKAVKAMQEAKIPGDYVIAAKKFSDIGDDTYLDCKKLRGECLKLQKKLENEIAEAERKKKIETPDNESNPYGLSDEVIERNERIAKELLLSTARYPLKNRIQFKRKLNKAFKVAMSSGEDLNDPEVLNKIFEVAAFRVEYRSY
ncbi:MAG: toll/interleukin-1 receptor domain-containing protein, partial [Oscillospiraceae bacterium]|nr:toll/interleukin-1 receptor domain-containing protein [Oscillospiraceae bacterium]